MTTAIVDDASPGTSETPPSTERLHREVAPARFETMDHEVLDIHLFSTSRAAWSGAGGIEVE